MASEEKRRALLALTPLLLHPPPVIQIPQFLYSTAETTDMGLVSAGTVGVAALAMDASQPKKKRPRPSQGGCWITAQYLRELPDTEAKWTFRYVF